MNDVDPNNPGSGFDNWMSAVQQGFNVQNSPVKYDVNMKKRQNGFTPYDNEGKTLSLNLDRERPEPMSDSDIKQWYAPDDFKTVVAMDKLFNGDRWRINRQKRAARKSPTAPKNQSIEDIANSIYQN